MCKYIFPALLYSQISYDSMCTDSFFLEVALFNTQWRLDVLLKISPGIKQKNIIRTGLCSVLFMDSDLVLYSRFGKIPACSKSKRMSVNLSQQKRLSVSSLHFQRHNSLDGFTAEQILYTVKYKCPCHLMVDVVNKQPMIQILILKLLKTIVWEYGWDRECEADAGCTVEVRSDGDSDGKICRTHLQCSFPNETPTSLNPFHSQ